MIGLGHIIYFIPSVISIITIFISWENNLIKNRFIFYLFISMVILFFGTRGNIDIDYSGYLENYNSITKDFRYEIVKDQYGEILSNYINVIFRFLNLNYEYLLLFLTSISILVKAKIIINYSKFPLAVISVYFCLALIETEMITIRWAVSSSFAILSLLNFSDNKVKSLLYILIAAGFHSFAYLYLLALPIISFKQLKFYYTFVLSCFFAGLFLPMESFSSIITLYVNTQNYTINKINSYSSQDENTIGFFSILLLVYLFTLVMSFRYLLFKKNIEIEILDQKVLKIGLVCIGISLLFIKYKVFFYRANIFSEFFFILLLINFTQKLVKNKFFNPAIYLYIIFPFILWNILDVQNQTYSKNILEYKNAIISLVITN
jgi:hypothetical protein